MYWYIQIPGSSWVHVKTMYICWIFILCIADLLCLVCSWYTSGMYLICNRYFLSTYWVPHMCALGKSLVFTWYLPSIYHICSMLIWFIPVPYHCVLHRWHCTYRLLPFSLNTILKQVDKEPLMVLTKDCESEFRWNVVLKFCFSCVSLCSEFTRKSWEHCRVLNC